MKVFNIYRIDGHGVIKVADFGLTEDMYCTNYFRRDKSVMGSEERVPIRWMAPESIENDIYNESTDMVRAPIPHESKHIFIKMLKGIGMTVAKSEKQEQFICSKTDYGIQQ